MPTHWKPKADLWDDQPSASERRRRGRKPTDRRPKLATDCGDDIEERRSQTRSFETNGRGYLCGRRRFWLGQVRNEFSTEYDCAVFDERSLSL